MPITSVEQSKYITQQQQYLADAKIGQYAKFLNKNPIFVTYYQINQAQSRVDAGIGSAYEHIGPQSPTRYNRIKDLPVFNFPETLRPDVVTDDGGYDIAADISDLTFIAGTVRPREGDCIKVEIPGAVPLLFQCTQFRYNTIQSHDYYMGDFQLLDVKQEYCIWIENQVEDKLICKFENIGTNNKVFLTEEEDAAASTLQNLIDTLSQFYLDTFYNEDIDGFVCYNGNPFGTQWYYDNYLTKFINDSGIYQKDNSDFTLVLPYLDLTPPNFVPSFNRTLWYAVLQRSKEFLNVYTYAWNSWIHNRTSPFVLASYPTITPNLHITDQYIKPQESIPMDVSCSLPWSPGKICGWDGVDPMLRSYFSLDLLKSLKTNVCSSNLDHIEKMIFTYISIGPKAIMVDRSMLIQYSFNQDINTYMYMPIVIYILKAILSDISSVD